MYVFAFDRDWTVDVNPHPDREAVPLEWVRTLAHDTEHAVYAIGNQALAQEAAIPGVVDIVGKHTDAWENWLGEKTADGRYERYPTRRERLDLIRDLHPQVERYFVIDDLDLSDVTGWEHYHAWEFVPAVRDGELPVGLPSGTPVPDGGVRTTAGIIPIDANALTSFIEEFGDSPAYELAYTHDGDEESRFLWEIELDTQSVQRPAAAAIATCTPLKPGEEPFLVRVDAIERLSAIEIPDGYLNTTQADPDTQAIALYRQAAVAPEAVSIPQVLDLLQRSDRTEYDVGYALKTIQTLAETRPTDCLPAIPLLRELLSNEPHRGHVLGALRKLSEASAPDITPLIDDIIPYLESPSPEIIRDATKCVMEVADHDPAEISTAVPVLAELLTTETKTGEYAAFAISSVSRENPHSLHTVDDSLQDAIVDRRLSDQGLLNILAALGRLTQATEEAPTAIVDALVEFLDTENKKLRNNAMGLLSDIAIHNTVVIRPHAETIQELLTVSDTYTRVNASGSIARIAEDFPEAVEPAIPDLIPLLSDEDEIVRENACWALGHMQATTAKQDLEALARTDDHASVRQRAVWALDQIENATPELI